MAYNDKQYDAARDFLPAGDGNVTMPEDQLRIQTYDLYENIYRNATIALKIVMRGDDQSPIIMPNGRKIVEATTRFLAKNPDYLVEAQGDEGAQQLVDAWFSNFWSREAFVQKFNSNKRWGLVRADAYFYLYANPNKPVDERISIRELDPRQVFEIEDSNGVIGVHIVDLIQDWRDADKPDKKVARRRTFRIQKAPDGTNSGVTSELTFWEVGKWDDRTPALKDKQEKVTGGNDEPEELLPAPITQLPVYKWRNNPPQNSTWGTSLLAGLETLLYAINQSLSDEDATLVFQGLGMYVTNAAPPIDPNTGDVTDWNIGPKQIIEISGDQRFERVTGVTDTTPLQNHMNYINDGMAEASGTPQIAVGRVDVNVAESGIAMQMELMPLISANAEKELEIITTMDQMFHDIVTMWLPAYETETFGNADIMSQLSAVCIFDDPMPKNHDAQITELVTLDGAGLILKVMVVAKLRELGWRWPTHDPNGNALDDNALAQMLMDQTAAVAAASDPFSQMGGFDDGTGDGTGDQGGNTPSQQSVDLGITQ